MATLRLQFPLHPCRSPTIVGRDCISNRFASCVYLRSRSSPNTALRLSSFRNSFQRWVFAPDACLRTTIASEDRPGPSPTPVLEEEDQTHTAKPKTWFYLFAEAALCYLIWPPSENILRFIFVITSSSALASVEFLRKFVREHIQDLSERESRGTQSEETLTSDCSRITLPSSSLEFWQGRNPGDEEDGTVTLQPKVWLYLFIEVAFYYFMRAPSKNALLLAFVITSCTALESVHFIGKFVQKYIRYLRLIEFHSREAAEAPSSYCPKDIKRVVACERKFFRSVLVLMQVCLFFLSNSFLIFALGRPILMPSVVALRHKLWSPGDVILAITVILTPCLLTALALSVWRFLGYLLQLEMTARYHEGERCKEKAKLKLCTKPQQSTEAEETRTTAYSRATFPSSFAKDKQDSSPTTKEDYKTNKFKRILFILFCLSVPVLCFYFFLVNVLEAMQFGKSLLHPVALCYSLWTPSGETLRALFPITSFLAMSVVGFFRMVLQEHLRYLKTSEYPVREGVRRKEIKAVKLLVKQSG